MGAEAQHGVVREAASRGHGFVFLFVGPSSEGQGPYLFFCLKRIGEWETPDDGFLFRHYCVDAVNVVFRFCSGPYPFLGLQ